METLHYYYKKGLEPFRSIMEFSDGDIIEFMSASLPEERVFNQNPLGYIKRRRDTENWLRSNFCKKGGKPINASPIYMTVGRSSYIESLGIYSECVLMPLFRIPEDVISFTYPDSYVSKWLAETEAESFNPRFHGQVFTLSDLPFLLEQNVSPNEAWRIEGRKFDFFIEAQIWDSEYLNVQECLPLIHPH